MDAAPPIPLTEQEARDASRGLLNFNDPLRGFHLDMLPAFAGEDDDASKENPVIQEVHPIDSRHDRRRITLQSGTEAQAYRKTFIDSTEQHTHTLRVRWLDEMHFEVWPEPLSLAEIGARSDGFTKLSTAELRWLADNHKIDISAVKNTSAVGDREAIIGKLVELAKAPPTAAAQPLRPSQPTPSVVPAVVREMDDPTLETRAVELGVATSTAGWAKLKRPAKEQALAKALAK
jgi:hypothetical protein